MGSPTRFMYWFVESSLSKASASINANLPDTVDSISITPGELPPLDQLFNNACLCSTVFYSLFYVCELCTDTQSLELL